MIVELVYCVTLWLHAFPAQDVSAYISPREFVSGTFIDASRHCRLTFGALGENYEGDDITMKSRTIGAIAPRETENRQRGYFFLSFQNEQRIVRNHWTETAATNDVIA